MFDDYPLDAHKCQFQVGSCKNQSPCSSFVNVTDFSRLWHNRDCGLLLHLPLQRQETAESAALHPYWAPARAVQSGGSTVRSVSKGFWAQKSFSIHNHIQVSSNGNNFNFPRSLRRMRLSSESRSKTDAISDPGKTSSLFALSKIKFQVYLPSFMFVVTSWVSFLIKPEVVPGRMALLVTLFLVLINIFNSVR